MAVLQDVLLASFVRDVISRVKLPTKFLSRHFGWGWDGANIQPVPGRVYTYDIYDNVRTVSNARLPGAPSGTVAASSVGNNTVSLARFAEKLPLDYNQVNYIRVLGKGASDRDRAGMTYIQAQVRTLRERAENVWEFLTMALFNGGKYYFYQNGDDLVPTFTTTNFGVDLKINANNLGNLAGPAFAACLPMSTGSNIITNPWSDPINGTPIRDTLNVSSAFQDSPGAPCGEVWCGTDVWYAVLATNEVRALAGSANQPFAEWDRLPDSANGVNSGVMRGQLRGLPDVIWNIWDGSLSLATTNATTFGNVKILPRKVATFTLPVDNSWIKGIHGSEIVKDNDWTEPIERYGLYTWAMEKADPAKVWYHTLQNCGVELNVPGAIASARVLA